MTNRKALTDGIEYSGSVGSPASTGNGFAGSVGSPLSSGEFKPLGDVGCGETAPVSNKGTK